MTFATLFVLSWWRDGSGWRRFPATEVFLAVLFTVAAFLFVHMHVSGFKRVMESGEKCRVIGVAKGLREGEVVAVLVKFETIESGYECRVYFDTNQLGAFARVGQELSWSDLRRMCSEWRQEVSSR